MSMISWLQNNKLKYFIINNIVLIANIFIFNFVKNGFLIDIDMVYVFIITNIILGLIFVISKIWIFVTRKFNFLFIQVGGIGDLIFYFTILLFLFINILLIFLIWINKDLVINVYFSIPWIITIIIDAKCQKNRNLKISTSENMLIKKK